jgi:L-threonine-O-3-phosphate decarboxylase
VIAPHSHISNLPAVHHGSISRAELAALGFGPDEVLDFSVNTNPLGPSPRALEAARTVDWARYPDDGAPEMRRALAARAGRTEAEVIVGNGSMELIWLLALAFLAPRDPVVIVGPTFGEYRRAAGIVGAVVQDWNADPTRSFRVDLGAVGDMVAATQARMVFLCNPNNPTGATVSPSAIGALARGMPRSLIVVDEAYRQFLDEPPSTETLVECDNVVLLRSLTKDYALSGLRLGYALAPASLISALDRVRPPWNVNAVACAAGLAALGDAEHLERARDEGRRARVYLTGELGALGWHVVPSAANFLLVDVGDAARVRAALLQRGICVRDCSSFGLPAYIRIGLRTVSECKRLVVALAAVGRAPA